MKKTLLFIVIIFSFSNLFAQVDVLPIGISPNVLTSAGVRTQLWADPKLNSVILMHRAGGDSLLYDISTDGGVTWLYDLGNFNTPGWKLRYPQGVIYNPIGNTNPDSAYISFLAAVTDSVNWLGVAQGVKKIKSGFLPSSSITTNGSSGLNHQIPNGYMITPQGTLWSVDGQFIANQYAGALTVTKGTWNSSNKNFDYTTQVLSAPVTNAPGRGPRFQGCNIAFAPGGQIGYVVMSAHQSYSFQPDSAYYPVVYMTTDGGNTWGSAITINLDGVDALFPHGTPYNMGPGFDIVVDGSGNLHIVSEVMTSNDKWDGYTNNNSGNIGLFDIYTTNLGQSWIVALLGIPDTYLGIYGGGTNPIVNESLRPQASIDSSGSKVFFTWFDTDTILFAGVGNTQPNVILKGYDLATQKWTPTLNMTENTNADAYCTFGNVSYYVLNAAGTYTVPVTITSLVTNPISTGNTVQHQYVAGITVTNSEFNLTGNPGFINSLNGKNSYATGIVFYDTNNNGIQDGGETGLAYQKINVQPGNYSLFTNDQGKYYFYGISFGDHTLACVPPLHWHISSDSLSYTVALDSTIKTGFDFGISPDSNYYHLSVSMVSGFPRCGTNIPFSILLENDGTTITNGSVKFNFDPKVTYVSSIPTPDTISGNILTYNFTAFPPFTSKKIDVTVHLPSSLDTIKFQASALYDSSGIYKVLAPDQLSQVIRCSYDPNDKDVQPSGVQSSNYTLSTEKLKYTIRFQNTGNDTAFKVIVRDTLNSSLDVNTFKVIGSSHVVETTIYPPNIVEFSFTNILLVDSTTNEKASHGFVQYSIMPKSGISLPVSVNNTAYIYFDYNLPIVTNTTKNTLVLVIPTDITNINSEDNSVIVTPNPFHESAEITINDSQHNHITNLKIMNELGDLILTRAVEGTHYLISKGNLATGIYFYELQEKSGKLYHGKFIIQ